MKLISSFPQRLAEIANGMGVTELAIKLGVSKQSVSAYIKGKRKPKSLSLYAMAQILSVQPQWLMGYDVDKYLSAEPDIISNNTVNTSNCKQSTAIGQYVGDGTDKKNEISEALAEIYQMLTKDNRTKLIVYAAKLLSEQSDPDG